MVSPDVGGVVRARAVAKRLQNADLAIIDKRRPSNNEVEVMHVIGDPQGRDCIIIDDIIINLPGMRSCYIVVYYTCAIARYLSADLNSRKRKCKDLLSKTKKLYLKYHLDYDLTI